MRELRSGLSEIVKCAIISDENLFKKIENNIEFILNKDPEVILSIIRKCVKIKAEFIELDEKDEKGIRIALNFGHTLGHALEILDSDMRHGEAIAIGMIFAGKLSMRLGLIKKDDFTRYNELLRKICLIKNIPLIDTSKIVRIMHKDKKNTSNSINFVLPTGIGKKPILKPLDEKLIISELKMQNVK